MKAVDRRGGLQMCKYFSGLRMDFIIYRLQGVGGGFSVRAFC